MKPPCGVTVIVEVFPVVAPGGMETEVATSVKGGFVPETTVSGVVIV
jgi:hypothetical protein